MVSYGLTIFLSAFLLFQVQPLAGKHTLPWFGGSPAVWTTCMLFFQVGLLAGYGYAHYIVSRRNSRFQALLHLALLAATLFLLPIAFHDTWKPDSQEAPVWHLLALLSVAIGIHYFVLSTTGPLLQAWFGRSYQDKSPYRLYALSNIGSLLGLLAYPFLIEPTLTLQRQTTIWSVTYGLFALTCMWCAWQLYRRESVPQVLGTSKGKGDFSAASNLFTAPQGSAPRDTARAPSVSLTDTAAWLFVAACGSVLLLAGTNQMCQDVAVLPFLWVLPLSLYLITFIVAFAERKIYRRRWSIPLLFIALLAVALELNDLLQSSLLQQIGIYAAAIFAGCMVCHGELARHKPEPAHLTFFYLTVASGGAMGGIFVAVIAPFLFKGYWEFHLSLICIAIIGFAVLFFEPGSPMRSGRRLGLWVPMLLSFSALVFSLLTSVARWEFGSLDASRSFYGILHVKAGKDPVRGPYRELFHGQIIHGIQYMDPGERNVPTSYYGKGTGLWYAMEYHPKRLQQASLHIGAVGLGTGTIAAYGRKGDSLRFYEINPDVLRFSEKWFRYLKDTPAQTEVVLGDGRIQLEMELARNQKQQFDILVADAFSGDAIPLHLLTRECAQVYRQHLNDNGILAINISNQHLDLKPVTLGMAQALQWEAVLVDTEDNADANAWAATWVLITADQAFLQNPAVQQAANKLSDKVTPLLWTDEYTSLFHVLN